MSVFFTQTFSCNWERSLMLKALCLRTWCHGTCAVTLSEKIVVCFESFARILPAWVLETFEKLSSVKSILKVVMASMENIQKQHHPHVPLLPYLRLFLCFDERPSSNFDILRCLRKRSYITLANKPNNSRLSPFFINFFFSHQLTDVA